MRLTHLRANDVYSFKSIDIQFNDDLSVIVGPNASGKTNLGRVLDLAVQAISACASSEVSEMQEFADDWPLYGRYGASEFTVSLGLEFDHPHEIALINNWTRAAVISALSTSSFSELPEWLDANLPADIGGSRLFRRGEFVARRDARDRWPWRFEWRPANEDVSLGLWGRHVLGDSTSGTLASDIFRYLARLETGELPRHLMALPNVGGDDTYWNAIRNFDIGDLFSLPGNVEFQAKAYGVDREIEPIRALQAEFPLWRANHSRSLNYAEVLHKLICSSVLLTSNTRISAKTDMTFQEFAQAGNLRDGSGVAVELHRLKNGNSIQRARFRDTQRIFAEVTGLGLEVVHQFFIERPEDMRLQPMVLDKIGGEIKEVALSLSGAGLQETALLCLLATHPVDLLLLDEPGVNVAPTMQRRLARAVKDERQGRQTLMITHSPDMVPVQDELDLTRVIRLDRRESETKVHLPNVDRSTFLRFKGMLQLPQIRALLFATALVIVEGRTEVDALEEWLRSADQHDLPTPESIYVPFLTSGGDQELPKYAELAQILGVPCAIVADGPAYMQGGALSKLKAPFPEIETAENESFDSIKSRWQDHKVRTLATEFGDGDKGGEIEAFFEKIDATVWSGLLIDAGRKDKPLLGYRFASSVRVPTEVLELWSDLLADLGLGATRRGSI